MNARYFLVFFALLFFANAAIGGTYLRTKDGKTMVWNNYPQPGDIATWAGKRDDDGYATGPGTITWLNTKPIVRTGSNIPLAKRTVITSYTGTMVHGKLDGMVTSVDPNGKQSHGAFADGRKTGKWASGPAPKAESAVVAQPPNEPARRAESVEPPAPAAGPPEPPAPAAPVAVKQPAPKPAKTETAKSEDDSLQSIISPTSLSRMNATGDSTPPAPPPPAPAASKSASLTSAEASELADTAARSSGLNPDQFQRLPAEFSAAEEMWSVSYEQKSADGMTGKQFTVRVDGKTKKTTVVR